MSSTTRLARREDLAAINDIYNYYVTRSTCTYQETLEPIEARQDWYERHGPRHPITVHEVDGQILGWGSLSPFHARSAYRFSVENSVYVEHAHQRRGIGDVILSDLIARAHVIGHRTIIAVIDASQEGSVALHAKHGFVKAARLEQVGYKFERWLDLTIMQLMVSP